MAGRGASGGAFAGVGLCVAARGGGPSPGGGAARGAGAGTGRAARRFRAGGSGGAIRVRHAARAEGAGVIARVARPEDAAGIAEIWNRYIRDTAVTFTTVEKTQAGLAADIAARQAQGLFWVAEAADGMLGFATAF